MDRNRREIELLKDNPEKLLVDYQPMIWAIVRQQTAVGKIRYGDQDDMVQEINKKLLERIPRIQKQYNQTSKLRTYFSVIIRNICLEEFRKPALLLEPDPDPYGLTDMVQEPEDLLVYNQELERLNRVFIVMGRDGHLLKILLKVMHEVPVQAEDFALFSSEGSLVPDAEALAKQFNDCGGTTKKEMYVQLSKLLPKLLSKSIPPDSLRKWIATRQEECLQLMNGDPPRSAYDSDTLGYLIEMIKLKKKYG